MHDWIITQYTGLKNKNCKDIYEGDVVKLSGLSWYPDKQIVVKSGLDCHFKIAYLYRWSKRWSKKCGNIEVVENIYENHELIE